MNSMPSRDLRRDLRVDSGLVARISIGTQLTIQGQLKDISLKSAFIRIKSSVFLNVNDEVGFTIECSSKSDEDLICGQACVSRMVPGEGVAIYFTKIDEASLKRLKGIVPPLDPNIQGMNR